MKKFMLVFAVAIILSPAAFGDLLYVDQDVDVDAEGYVGDGSSWDNAFPALYSAIEAAERWDRIWVAEGVYTQGTPEPSTHELMSMPDRVRLYGGFVGTETTRSQRDWEVNETILDASDAAPGGGQTLHVVVMESVAYTRIDGFTITGGNADGGGNDSVGGGIYCSDLDDTNIIANCTITGNSADVNGAGISCSYADPQILDCAVTDNNGTGIYLEWFSSPSIDGSTISDNLYSGVDCFAECSPSFTNCVISGNGSKGIYAEGSAEGSELLITNCTIAGNSEDGVHLAMFEWLGMPYGADATITNTIFAENEDNGIYEFDVYSDASTRNCLFFDNGTDYFDEGSTERQGADDINNNVAGAEDNIDGNPLFLNIGPGDYHLTDGSPCIDAGFFLPWVPTTDFDGESRPAGDVYDIGADEFVDTDGDGLSDYEENMPDSDGDGYIDAIEIDAGTEPDNPDDYPLWYVDIDNTVGPWDGLSWATAYTAIQDGIDDANTLGAGEVWVAGAEAIYAYTAGTPEANTTELVAMFTMKKNVNVYGGFTGTETTPEDRDNRDWNTYVTELDGSADPLYHVVLGARNAILDGFTITGGRAAGTAGEPYHTRCGGGLYNTSLYMTVRNCIFSDNSAASSGGGIYNTSSSLTVENCEFTSNATTGSASTGLGGGLCNEGGSAIVTNCLFIGNDALGSPFGYGGGIANINSSPTVMNCTFSDNSATSYAGGMFNWGSSAPTITNSILWGDLPDEIGNSGGTATVTYSDVQGGYAGEGNIDLDPQFEADYVLAEGSPCIDAGTWVGAPEYDILGITRPYGMDVDMGAYEFQAIGVDPDGDDIPSEEEGMADPDGDGIPNYLDDDSDGDGISDADEGIGDPDGDDIPNYLDLDSDGDGISDADEGSGDPDGDDIPNYLDLNSDSDTDTILDADEDSDVDGLNDDQEDALGTDPADADTDDDGVRDGREVNTDGTDPLRSENLRIDGFRGGVADTRSGLRVEFPAGFLASGSILADITVPGSAPPGTVPAGVWLTDIVFDLEPSGTEFDLPATVIVVYDSADAFRFDETTLTPVYWTGTEYSGDGLTLVSRNPDSNTVIFTTTHFTVFALVGQSVGPIQGTPATSWFGLGILCLVVAAAALFAQKRSGMDKEGQTPSEETS